MTDVKPRRRMRAEDLGRIELRIVACIGRAEGYLSISELAREVGIDRHSVRSLLYGLVSMGVLEETGQIGKRPVHRLIGMTMEEIEAAEERPILSDEQDYHAVVRGRGTGNSGHDPDAPTENEEKVLEFLRRPATQDEIAEQFGYGRSRRSEVVRSLISKGLARKCGSIGLKDLFVRTEVSDEEAEAYSTNLRKDEIEAARRREEIVHEAITEPMTLLQVAERTGLTDADVRSSAASLLNQGKIISIRSFGGTRYARVDSQNYLVRAALKWKDVRLRHRELEVLNCLEFFGRPATAKEVSGALGIDYVHTCYNLRMLMSYGLVTRERGPAPRSQKAPGSFLFSLKNGHPAR